MAKKREKVDTLFTVPMTAALKASIEKLARLDERTPAAVARRVLRDGIESELRRRTELVAAAK